MKAINRFLYRYNMQTGERGGRVDVTDMLPKEILIAESRLWAEVEEPRVIRDSANDDARSEQLPIHRKRDAKGRYRK